MERGEADIVKLAIQKHGDDFWNNEPEGEEFDSNTLLFDDIVSFLNKEGLDLKLVKLGE